VESSPKPRERSTDPVARAVNLAWQLEKERRSREAQPVDPFTATHRRIDDLERELEAVKAALFADRAA
jgi:hypothetical protein